MESDESESHTKIDTVHVYTGSQAGMKCNKYLGV